MVSLAEHVFSNTVLQPWILERLSAYELSALSCASRSLYLITQAIINTRRKEVDCVPHKNGTTLESIKKYCQEQLQVPPAYCILFLSPEQLQRYNNYDQLNEILCVPRSCQVFVIGLDFRRPFPGTVICAFIPRGLSDFSMNPITDDHVEFPVPDPRLAVLMAQRTRFRNLNYDPNVILCGADSDWRLRHFRSLYTRYNLRGPPVNALKDNLLGFVIGGKNVKVKSIVRYGLAPRSAEFINTLKSVDERPELGATGVHNSDQENCSFAFHFVYSRVFGQCMFKDLLTIHDRDQEQFRISFPRVPLISIYYYESAYGQESGNESMRSRRTRGPLLDVLSAISRAGIWTFAMVTVDVNED